jgi:hypothetical protein
MSNLQIEKGRPTRTDPACLFALQQLRSDEFERRTTIKNEGVQSTLRDLVSKMFKDDRVKVRRTVHEQAPFSQWLAGIYTLARKLHIPVIVRLNNTVNVGMDCMTRKILTRGFPN